METHAETIEWEFFDKEGAIFRRPKGNIGGVTHVFGEKTKEWLPYQGADKMKPVVYGDRCDDPSRDNQT